MELGCDYEDLGFDSETKQVPVPCPSQDDPCQEDVRQIVNATCILLQDVWACSESSIGSSPLSSSLSMVSSLGKQSLADQPEHPAADRSQLTTIWRHQSRRKIGTKLAASVTAKDRDKVGEISHGERS